MQLCCCKPAYTWIYPSKGRVQQDPDKTLAVETFFVPETVKSFVASLALHPSIVSLWQNFPRYVTLLQSYTLKMRKTSRKGILNETINTETPLTT